MRCVSFVTSEFLHVKQTFYKLHYGVKNEWRMRENFVSDYNWNKSSSIYSKTWENWLCFHFISLNTIYLGICYVMLFLKKNAKDFFHFQFQPYWKMLSIKKKNDKKEFVV